MRHTAIQGRKNAYRVYFRPENGTLSTHRKKRTRVGKSVTSLTLKIRLQTRFTVEEYCKRNNISQTEHDNLCEMLEVDDEQFSDDLVMRLKELYPALT